MALIEATKPSGVDIVSDRKKPGPDVISFVVMVALISVGVLMIFASTRQRLELLNLDPGRLMQRQIIFAVVAIAVYVIASLIDYREYRNIAAGIYLGTLALLAVLISGLFPEIEGVKRWIPLGPFRCSHLNSPS